MPPVALQKGDFMSSVVIIGAGLAGYTVAKELRAKNQDIHITILTQDAGHFYSKPMLSNAFTVGKSPDQLVQFTATEMMEKYRLEVISQAHVHAVDPLNKYVTISNDENIHYDHLIFALGAEPFRGELNTPSYAVNHLNDYRSFRAAIADKEKIAILGAGLIGCEFANDLALSGKQVDVLDISDYPLARFLPQESGEFFAKHLEKIGVKWHFGSGVVKSEVMPSGSLHLETFSEDSLEVDVLLTALGLIPNIQLAKDSGIWCRRGILVDDYFRTNYENCYALGDCVEYQNRIWPFVMPIMHAARAIVKSILGEPTRVQFPVMPIAVKTPTCPVTFYHPDHVAGPFTWHLEESSDHSRVYLAKNMDSLTCGFIIMGASAQRRKQDLLARLQDYI